MRMGEDFIAESQSRLSEIDRHLAEAAQYQEVVANGLLQADRFRVEGQIRMAQFNSILANRAEYRKRMGSIPVTQPAGGPIKPSAAPRTDRIDS